MRFLPTLRQTKNIDPMAAPQPSNQRINPAVADYPAPEYGEWAQAGYSRNELVFACIFEKMTTTAEAPLKVFSKSKGDALDNHALRQLIERPNPLQMEADLWEMVVLHLDIAGNAFVEIIRDRLGRPVELWPIRPDRIRIVPVDRAGISHVFLIRVGQAFRVVEPQNMVHVKYPNPTSDLVGQPPMRSSVRAVALDNEATDFVKALLQNHATPGLWIEAGQKMDKTVAQRVKDEWKESFGGSNRGEPAVLQTGMQVHQLGLSLRDLEFPDLRTISESRICMSFGVPPALISAKVGLDRNTFTNYPEARKSFWEETVIPLQRRIRDAFALRLLPDFEGRGKRNIEFRWDRSEVVALRDSETEKWQRGTEALKSGGVSVNDFRRHIGLPEVEGGDVFLRPAGVEPVPPERLGDPAKDDGDEGSEAA